MLQLLTYYVLISLLLAQQYIPIDTYINIICITTTIHFVLGN